MISPEMSAELGRLMQLEVDAVTAYGAAVSAAEPGAIRAELVLFQIEHQRRALALHEAYARLRACPPEVTPNVKGLAIGASADAPRRPGLGELVATLRGNVQLAGSVYAKALARPLPPEVHEAVAQALAEERHHLAWLQRTLEHPAARR